MTVTLTRLHHFGMIVNDLDVSMAFYDRLLGMTPTTRQDIANSPGLSRQMQVEHAEVRVAFYEVSGGVAVELIEVRRPEAAKVQPQPFVPGSKHLCFYVDDISKAYEAMREEGYAFHGEPARFDEGQGALAGVNFAYFRDPDGNVIEILEDPKKKGLATKAAQTIGLK